MASGPASVSVLAYARVECTVRDGMSTARHSLYVRRGEEERLVVSYSAGPFPADTEASLPDIAETGITVGLLCDFVAGNRFGPGAAIAQPIQDIAVSPDGSQVVYEFEERFSVLPDHIRYQDDSRPGEPVEAGIYLVGTGDAPPELIYPTRNARSWFRRQTRLSIFQQITFTPDGDSLVFPVGAGEGETRTEDLVRLDLRTGSVEELTDLNTPFVCCPRFLDASTLDFGSAQTFEVPAEGPPRPDTDLYTLQLDGDRTPVRFGTLTEQEGLRFEVAGQKPTVFTERDSADGATEVVYESDGRRLQLSNLGAADTDRALFANEAGLVVFVSSAETPTNPGRACQIFSVGTTGTNLTQITNFEPLERPGTGDACEVSGSGGCQIARLRVDHGTGAVVVLTDCDPLREGKRGADVFVMNVDGTGMQVLTHTAGVDRTDGVSVDIVGELAVPTRFASRGTLAGG